MRRVCFLLVLGGALAGCGSGAGDDATTTTSAAPAPKTPGSQPLVVGVTEGLVGNATAVTSDKALVSLSKGGKPDPAPQKRTPTEEGIAAGDECADANLTPAAGNLPAIAAATLCLVNAERKVKSLVGLKENRQLAAAAAGHSRDMVARSYFAHDGLDGSTMTDRVAATGYLPRSGRWALGENLAFGTGSLATPRSIVNSWMNSKGHRENVLDPRHREMGQGIVVGNPRRSNGLGATYAHVFGFRSQPASAERSALPRTGSRRAPTARVSTTVIRRLQRKRCMRFRGRQARACKTRVVRLARVSARR